jgi:hypothetical protein
MSLLHIHSSASTDNSGLQTAYRSSTYPTDRLPRLMLFSANAINLSRLTNSGSAGDS